MSMMNYTIVNCITNHRMYWMNEDFFFLLLDLLNFDRISIVDSS